MIKKNGKKPVKTGRYQKFDRTGPATGKPAGHQPVCRFLPVRFQVWFTLFG
jgi:hypothetical protein